MSIQGTSEIYSASREPLPMTNEGKKTDPFFGFISKPASPNPGRTIAYLPESGQVLRALPAWQVPKAVVPEGKMTMMIKIKMMLMKIMYIHESGQGLRALPAWQVPKAVVPEGR